MSIEDLDRTHIHDTNPINSMVVIEETLKCVKGLRLLHCNKITPLDHRACMIDFNAEEYFQDDISNWQEINHVKLNLSRWSHREMFADELEHQLEMHNLEESVCLSNLTCQQIENVDKFITWTLDAARKKVEGISKEKVSKVDAIRH